jgi:purine-binding chemotaxis protein CheW
MKKILTFYLNNNILGIDIDLVKEITRNIEYTPIFDTKEYITGLMNLRGTIVTIFNLCTLLGYESFEEQTTSKCVILKTDFNNTDQIGFLVDKTGDVIAIDEENLYALPENYIQANNQYIFSAIKYHEILISILDFKKILEIEKI